MNLSRLFFKVLFLLLFFTASTSSWAQDGVSFNFDTDTLVVGIAGSEPFIIKGEDAQLPKGLTIDIWEAMADESGWNYVYHPYATVSDALRAVEKGQIDMVAGPISITAKRLEHMRFSQPFYQSSLSIASKESGGILDTLASLFSFKLLFAVAGFLFMLAIVGTLFWLAERKKNPEEFPASPTKGIGNGMWLAVVTMSTVGYGDMAPKSAVGRVIAGAWIIITIIFATSMVAGIASVLTLAGTPTVVTNVEQLSGQKAATVAGSPAEDFLRANGVKSVATQSLEEAFSLLENETVQAVVYDRPEVEYYIFNHPEGEFHLSSAEYYKQGYGFAFPQESQLVYKVNLKLLNLSEEHRISRMVERYLGQQN